MAQVTALQPPQALIALPTDPAEVITRAEKATTAIRQIEDAIVTSIKPEDATFDSVLLPIILVENTVRQEEKLLRFYSSTNPNEDLRDASAIAARILDDGSVDSYMREDVFKLVDVVLKNTEVRDPESYRYLERRHRKYLEHGLGLPSGPLRDRFRIVRKRISELSRECSKNFNSDNGGVWLSRKDLKGLPDDVIDRMKPGEEGIEHEGKIWHSFRMDAINTTLENAEKAQTRKHVFLAAENRCAINVPLITELVLLRKEMAQLLGHASFADLETQYDQAKSPGNVMAFLNDLKDMLTPKAKEDMAKLLELKKQAAMVGHTELEDSTDALYFWDQSYYRAQMNKMDLELDQSEVAEYFELDEVLDGFFETFGRLLGVVVRPVSMEEYRSLPEGTMAIWHEDVRVVSVWDHENEGGAFLGYIYLDLHPREFKKPILGAYRLSEGFTKANGTRHYPSSAIIANYPKPTEELPSLLKHHELVAVFRRFGYGFRNLVTRTRFASSHSGYETDFLATPSRMLDYWSQSAIQIAELSRHYSYVSPAYREHWKKRHPHDSPQPPEKMPDSLITALTSAQAQCQSLDELKQVFLSSYALMVHQSDDSIDTTALYNRLREEITMLSGPSDLDPQTRYYWGCNQARFSHTFSKQWAATYYNYVYASCVAADMFYTVFKGDTTDEETGRKFRYVLLEPGGSRPPTALLEAFVGREPNNEAFVEHLMG